MDQYETAVAEAIANLLGALPDAPYAQRLQVGMTVLREADYDLDHAHGMMSVEDAAADALDDFGAIKRAARATL